MQNLKYETHYFLQFVFYVLMIYNKRNLYQLKFCYIPLKKYGGLNIQFGHHMLLFHLAGGHTTLILTTSTILPEIDCRIIC